MINKIILKLFSHEFFDVLILIVRNSKIFQIGNFVHRGLKKFSEENLRLEFKKFLKQPFKLNFDEIQIICLIHANLHLNIDKKVYQRTGI